jgi:hypothetical protein
MGIAAVVGDPAVSVSIMLAANAAAFVGLLYILLYRNTRRVLDAVLFTALSCATAAFFFWSSVPETFAFGATAVLATLVAMGTSNEKSRELMLVLTGVFTLGITPTNFVATLVCSVISLGWKRTLRVFLLSLVGVLVLWLLQRQFFLFTELFPDLQEEVSYVRWDIAFSAIRHFLLDAAYPLGVVDASHVAGAAALVAIDGASLRSAAVSTLLVWAVWLFVVLSGVRATWADARAQKLGVACTFIVLFQLGLHAFYGAEVNFLYSLHWVPLLVLLASCATRTRLRIPLLISCLLLVGAMGPRNHQLQQAAVARSATIGAHGTQ